MYFLGEANGRVTRGPNWINPIGHGPGPHRREQTIHSGDEGPPHSPMTQVDLSPELALWEQPWIRPGRHPTEGKMASAGIREIAPAFPLALEIAALLLGGSPPPPSVQEQDGCHKRKEDPTVPSAKAVGEGKHNDGNDETDDTRYQGHFAHSQSPVGSSPGVGPKLSASGPMGQGSRRPQVHPA